MPFSALTCHWRANLLYNETAKGVKNIGMCPTFLESSFHTVTPHTKLVTIVLGVHKVYTKDLTRSNILLKWA